MALINSTPELMKFVDIDKSTNWSSIKMHFDNAELHYVKKILGIQLYNWMGSNSPSSQSETYLFEKAAKIVASFGMYIGFPHMNVRKNDKGLTTSASNDHERAQKWMVDAAAVRYKNDGYAAIEDLFLFLEENKSENFYILWQNSNYYTSIKNTFCPTADLLFESLPIERSFWLFNIFKPFIKNAEELILIPSLGDAFYADLLAKFSNGTLSTDEAILVQKIQAILANYVYADSLLDPYCSQEIYNVAISPNESVPNINKQENSIYVFESTAKKTITVAENLLKKAKDFLNKNASTTLFPIYFNSDLYINPTNTKICPLNDSATGSFFMM